jgi:hypothetical protein
MPHPNSNLDQVRNFSSWIISPRTRGHLIDRHPPEQEKITERDIIHRSSALQKLIIMIPFYSNISSSLAYLPNSQSDNQSIWRKLHTTCSGQNRRIYKTSRRFLLHIICSWASGLSPTSQTISWAPHERRTFSTLRKIRRNIRKRQVVHDIQTKKQDRHHHNSGHGHCP